MADAGDADEALETLFAKDIQAQAQCFLTVMCYLGLGVPPGEAQYRQGVREVGKNDHLEAFKWFREAADEGHAEAQHSLGLLHTTGKRIVRDWSSAVLWFRKAAERGHAGAQYELGRMYQQGLSSFGQQKFPKGLSSYELQKDECQALKWLRRAAEQGHAAAQHCLGLLYSESNGLPQDDREAATWFGKAAKQGHALAQYKLGLMYEQGQGVLQDYVKAYAWLSLTAVQRSKVWAGQHRVQLESKMNPHQLAQAHRLAADISAEIELQKRIEGSHSQ